MDGSGFESLFVAKDWKDRKIQQALLQPHKPGNQEILKRYRGQLRNSASPNPRVVIEGARGAQGAQGEVNGRSHLSGERQRPFRSRSIVEPPKKWMGKKLLLDER